MIARIHGTLLALHESRAHLECGHLVHEVLVASVDQQRLGARIGEAITLHTLHYLEAQGQGSSFIPRLIGFVEPEDRAFFELFTTVKGMGNRKALRALALPFGIVATAIAEKDHDLLKSLPEIGKRTAETIVAELNGKVDRFVEMKPIGDASGSSSAMESEVVRDVINVLVQLGETRNDARTLIERVQSVAPELEDAEKLIEAALRLR